MATTQKSKEGKKEQHEKKKQSNSKETSMPKNSPSKKTPTKTSNNDKTKTTTSNNAVVSDEVLAVSSSSRDVELAREYENGSVKGSKKSNKRKEKVDEEEDDGVMGRFPMARIKRIMKCEEAESKLSDSIVFLVNKATEKFLEQICEEAYECSVEDRKKSLGYKHLAKAVGKNRRYDFLSEFIPEKITAEEALAQAKLAETGQD